MPTITDHAIATPDKPAFIMGSTGETVTFAELDATNPERQRMMEAWCQSDDPARTSDKKANFMCAKTKAKQEFYKRREELLGVL